MQLLIGTHKPCWLLENGDVVTDGGFPLQVRALSELFDRTTVVATRARRPVPSGLLPLRGRNLRHRLLPEPAGAGLLRKIRLVPWLLQRLPTLFREIRGCEVVHALVPGDVGGLVLLIAFALRKRLLIRQCGTWGNRTTLADRGLAWLLPRIAGGRVVVFATGGGGEPPEPGRPEIEWVFSTTLTETELVELPCAPRWIPGEPLRMITVGRLTLAKNVRACIEATAILRHHLSEVHLDIVGDGPARTELAQLVEKLGVEGVVTFHGNITHDGVMRALRRSHLLLFPTRTAEGFPKAVLEAMACGVAVVVTPVSVLPVLMAEGAGRVLGGTSGEHVAAAVLELAADPGAMEALGHRGREIARRYTLEAWTERIGERLQRAWGRPLRDKGGVRAGA